MSSRNESFDGSLDQRMHTGDQRARSNPTPSCIQKWGFWRYLCSICYSDNAADNSGGRTSATTRQEGVLTQPQQTRDMSLPRPDNSQGKPLEPESIPENRPEATAASVEGPIQTAPQQFTLSDTRRASDQPEAGTSKTNNQELNKIMNELGIKDLKEEDVNEYYDQVAKMNEEADALLNQMLKDFNEERTIKVENVLKALNTSNMLEEREYLYQRLEERVQEDPAWNELKNFIDSLKHRQGKTDSQQSSVEVQPLDPTVSRQRDASAKSAQEADREFLQRVESLNITPKGKKFFCYIDRFARKIKSDYDSGEGPRIAYAEKRLAGQESEFAPAYAILCSRLEELKNPATDLNKLNSLLVASFNPEGSENVTT